MNIFGYIFVMIPILLVIAVILIELWARHLLKRLDQIIDRMERSIQEEEK